jgi:hypothetical protein
MGYKSAIAIILLLWGSVSFGQSQPSQVFIAEYTAFANFNGHCVQIQADTAAISGLPNTIAGGACGAHHQLWFQTLATGGRLWSMGDNTYGELALNNTTSNFSAAQEIGNDSLGHLVDSVIAATCGAGVDSVGNFGWISAILRQKAAGNIVEVCGRTIGGIRGAGYDGNSNNLTFVPITFPTTHNIVQIAIAQVGYAMDDTGAVYSWGGHNNKYLSYYCLGQGPTPVYNTPTKIVIPGGRHASWISGGEFWGYIGCTDNTVWCMSPWTGYVGIGPANNLVAYNSPAMPGTGQPVRVDTAWSTFLGSETVSMVTPNSSGAYILTSGHRIGFVGGIEHGGGGNGIQINWATYPNGTATNPWNWGQGQGDSMQRKPVDICPGKNNWLSVSGSTALTYAIYLQDQNGNWYYIGRGKPGIYGGILANGIGPCDGALNQMQAAYPDMMNITWVTQAQWLPSSSNWYTTCLGCLTGQLTGNPCTNRNCSAASSPAAPSSSATAHIILTQYGCCAFIIDMSASTASNHVMSTTATLTGGPAIALGVNTERDTVNGATPGATYTVQNQTFDTYFGSSTASASITIASTTPPLQIKKPNCIIVKNEEYDYQDFVSNLHYLHFFGRPSSGIGISGE